MTCASVYSNLVLFLAAAGLAIPTLCGPRSAVSCLPVARQERDTDILAGADFLSILMDNSFVEEATVRDDDDDGYVRSSRSTPQQKNADDDVTTRRATKERQRPDLVAESSKSELSVEEGAPITKDVITTTAGDLEAYRGYAARVRPLPGSSYDPSPAGYEKYPRTVIYHDGLDDSARSRSVSYSSIVRDGAAPGLGAQQGPVQHGRQERNYDAARGYANSVGEGGGGGKNDSFYEAKVSTTTPPPPPPKDRRRVATTERNWETQERPYAPEPQKVYGRPEQNYEVDEVVSVVTNGRAHGVQPSLPPPQRTTLAADNQKVGYVVEGRNYRKSRVEERTADGFIVGEYGVVSHDDGTLRGVRYTADGTINPRLISEALMKFLSL